ncbi:MAG: hypothetical protein ACOCXQ_02640 [Patescibacteria group bacterium]
MIPEILKSKRPDQCISAKEREMEGRNYPQILCRPENRRFLPSEEFIVIDDSVALTPELTDATLDYLQQQWELGVSIEPLQQHTDRLMQVLVEEGILTPFNNPDNTLFILPGGGGQAMVQTLPSQLVEYGTPIAGKATRVKDEEGQTVGYDMHDLLREAYPYLQNAEIQQAIIFDDVAGTFGTAFAIREAIEELRASAKEPGYQATIPELDWVMAAAVAIQDGRNEGIDLEGKLTACAGTIYRNPDQARFKYASSGGKKIIKSRQSGQM